MHIGKSQWISTQISGPSICSAHITTNRNRSKIYEGNHVYLKDKQNFEIELHNPTQSKILAKISIDGREISQSGIVLIPGERVYLERFIDNNHKFLFETYEVTNTEESKSAILQNGLVEVSFHPEASSYTYSSTTTYGTFAGGVSTFTAPMWDGDSKSTNSYTVNCNIGIIEGTINPISTVFSGTTTNHDGKYSSPIDNTSSISLDDKYLESGRTEMGENSTQSFRTTMDNFNLLIVSKLTYQILPESLKPVEMSQIRNYCSGCGIRVKKASWKFCPGCGEKI